MNVIDPDLIAAMRSAMPDDTELRESLRAHGWVKQFPAIKDEHGVVLVGNRRLRLAAELGITAVVEVLVIGEGSEADAERFKLALVSNIGGATLTPAERKQYAIYLYNSRDWSQQRIADALGVTHQMVSLYIGSTLQVACNVSENSADGPATADGGASTGTPVQADPFLPGRRPPPAEPTKRKKKDTLGRTASTGRPRGSTNRTPTPPRATRQVQHDPDAAQRAAARYLDEGGSQDERADEAGIPRQTFRVEIAREEGRREGGIPYATLRNALTPIANALDDLARRTPGTIPNGSVSIQAGLLRNLLAEWREAGRSGTQPRPSRPR